MEYSGYNEKDQIKAAQEAQGRVTPDGLEIAGLVISHP
jgi:hypothetical protein